MRLSLVNAFRASMRIAFTVLATALLVTGRRAEAQIRERPVAFDSAGRVNAITPPFAARLRLSAPIWPVAGDYVDARLYAIDDTNGAYVLVVRRQREVLERYPMDAASRRELARAIEIGNALAITRGGPDAVPTFISEPVRGSFVVNQTLLGAFLFGPAASALVDEPAGGSAAYLAVTGSAFFLAANMTQSSSVSRAQNHLASHSALRGAIAADLLTYAVTGADGGRQYAGAILGGGIAGDLLGFALGEPMTDAEAHATTHGSTVMALLTTGILGTTGLFDNNTAGARTAAAAVVGAGVLGYPLGLRYARSAPYRVTAGDVSTLLTSELIGVAAAGALVPSSSSPAFSFGMLTTGFALGAFAGDQLFVRPFDHTESEARMVGYGSAAGALVAVAVPVLAQSGNAQVVIGTAALGGLLGAILTEQLIAPQRAGVGLGSTAPAGNVIMRRTSSVDVHFAPESVLLAGMGFKGNHSIVSL
ncbi:MAG: hypothetical protein ABI625_04565, partial [bacterium]